MVKQTRRDIKDNWQKANLGLEAMHRLVIYHYKNLAYMHYIISYMAKFYNAFLSSFAISGFKSHTQVVPQVDILDK